MKRLSSSDSLNALVSICPNSTDEQNPMYFQAMLEGLDEEESSGGGGQKKRRLSVDQVKALEKNFEVENKLEPERKVKLAQELGLQPRQVAVWFQNRRARWKTKQLEKDYGVLKASYDGLKLNFDKLQRDNESLIKQIGELKAKMKDEDQEANLGPPSMVVFTDHETKDGGGSSDDSEKKGSSMSSSVGGGGGGGGEEEEEEEDYFPVKVEEQNFLGEESCSTSLIFADDQAPTLHWYCGDEWELKEMV